AVCIRGGVDAVLPVEDVPAAASVEHVVAVAAHLGVVAGAAVELVAGVGPDESVRAAVQLVVAVVALDLVGVRATGDLGVAGAADEVLHVGRHVVALACLAIRSTAAGAHVELGRARCVVGGVESRAAVDLVGPVGGGAHREAVVAVAAL